VSLLCLYILLHFALYTRSTTVYHNSFAMRFLLASACLAQICSAFYPYHFPTTEHNHNSKTSPRAIEHPRRNLHEAERSPFYPYISSAKEEDDTSNPSPRTVQHPQSDDNGLLRVLLRRILTKRKNNFNIIPALDPKQSNSLGIDQDGTDFSYFCAFKFGTSSEEYFLLLDSAASNTWVMSSDCSTNACSVHNTFGPTDSTSLKVCSRSITTVHPKTNEGSLGLSNLLFRRLWHWKCQRHSRHRHSPLLQHIRSPDIWLGTDCQ
jgi:hypothetical protein